MEVLDYLMGLGPSVVLCGGGVGAQLTALFDKSILWSGPIRPVKRKVSKSLL